MPLFIYASPDPDGSKLWREHLRSCASSPYPAATARKLRPDLHARHVEHRRWLSHTRSTSTSAHSPCPGRAAAPAPVPRGEPVITVLKKSKNRFNGMFGDPPTYALPPLIKVGSFIFKTSEFLDIRYLQPEKINRRKVRRR